MALSFPASTTRRRAGGRLVLAVLGVALLAGAGMRVVDLVPDLRNPFAQTGTVDRSEPAVLHALADVAEFKAATANYSIVLDVEEDAKWLPSFVKGERTVFLAAGSVDATVDLSRLDAGAITMSADRRSVTIELPPATLSDAVVDPGRSRVVSQERGLVDRAESMFVENPGSERDLYLRAGEKLDAAARADAFIVERAEENTRRMLEGLLEPLGFEQVQVHFEGDL